MRKGQRTPDSVRLKMSMAAKGRIFTDEHRANLSKAMRGRPAHNKGVCGVYHHTPEQLAKQSDAQKGRTAANKGKHHTIETRLKMSKSRSGQKNPRWMGGISFEPYCPKFNRALKRRIRAFFDNRCLMCGTPYEETPNGLCCHHVEYSKSACCDGKLVQFAVLCHRCHGRTGADRERWEAMFHRIIDEMYAGRSYYTKEEMPISTISPKQ